MTAPRDVLPRARAERGVLVGEVGTAPDTTTGQDSKADIAATIGSKEHGLGLVDHVPTGADLPGNVELSVAPAAEPLEGVGEPEEALDLIQRGQKAQPVDPRGPEVLGGDVRGVAGHGVDQVQDLVGPAVPPAGTARGGAERVKEPAVDVAGDDHLHDAQPPAAGDLLSGDLPEVSDQAWEWMEPLLPSASGRRGRRWRDHRQMVEAICWKYRTGSPWRDLPARFGPWQTAYERLTRWRTDGTWARVLAQAQSDADADATRELDWLVAVVSTGVLVPQHGASTRGTGGRVTTASPHDPEQGVAA